MSNIKLLLFALSLISSFSNKRPPLMRFSRNKRPSQISDLFLSKGTLIGASSNPKGVLIRILGQMVKA